MPLLVSEEYVGILTRSTSAPLRFSSFPELEGLSEPEEGPAAAGDDDDFPESEDGIIGQVSSPSIVTPR